MPPVTLLSPYSGRPVVVREEDLGRAIRDDEGRVFYVVEDDEHGRYASMTRKGSAKDLERYRALQSGGAPAMNGSALAGAALSTSSAQQTQAYDATGTKRRNPVGIVVMLGLIVLLGAALYIALVHPSWLGIDRGGNETPSSPEQGQPEQSPAPAQGDRPPSIVVPAVFVDVDGQSLEEPGVGDWDAEQGVPAPTVGDSPAVLPDSPEAFADLLAQMDGEDPALMREHDPTPVIVPTRTWRPDRSLRVLSEGWSGRPSLEGFSHTASGLRYKLTHETDGPRAKAGSYLEVRYTMQTLDGEPLIDDGQQSFVLAAGQAIRAFDEGLAGVRAGEQLQLFIPRGHSASGALPGIDRMPDRPVFMDVQLVAVKPGVTHIVEEEGDDAADPAVPGDRVALHYVARVEGKDEVFDATAGRGGPMRLTLGRGEVITGLELGVAGMRVGETRLLTIPPYLAYGEVGAAGGLIPPDAVLSFRVTLVGIDKPEASD